jgi:hypothetical protein
VPGVVCRGHITVAEHFEYTCLLALPASVTGGSHTYVMSLSIERN